MFINVREIARESAAVRKELAEAEASIRTLVSQLAAAQKVIDASEDKLEDFRILRMLSKHEDSEFVFNHKSMSITCGLSNAVQHIKHCKRAANKTGDLAEWTLYEKAKTMVLVAVEATVSECPEFESSLDKDLAFPKTKFTLYDSRFASLKSFIDRVYEDKFLAWRDPPEPTVTVGRMSSSKTGINNGK